MRQIQLSKSATRQKYSVTTNIYNIINLQQNKNIIQPHTEYDEVIKDVSDV